MLFTLEMKWQVRPESEKDTVIDTIVTEQLWQNNWSVIKFQLLKILIKMDSLSISPATLMMKKHKKLSKQAEVIEFWLEN